MDRPVGVGRVGCHRPDPTLGLRVEIGRSVGGWSVVGFLVGVGRVFGRSVVGFWSVLPTHSVKFSFVECSGRKSGVLECNFYTFF